MNTPGRVFPYFCISGVLGQNFKSPCVKMQLRGIKKETVTIKRMATTPIAIVCF